MRQVAGLTGQNPVCSGSIHDAVRLTVTFGDSLASLLHHAQVER